eukprot:TRINITY_DN4819_c0_g2_i3.p1 TRINITY_DN4819_c0_g2~~TRINITY_DN4819_c0_g2_i3.p1  ORF type:complete len:827 (+),score=46.85 TRINITY_DN4819_c0_g2_i3:445-2925(+)
MAARHASSTAAAAARIAVLNAVLAAAQIASPTATEGGLKPLPPMACELCGSGSVPTGEGGVAVSASTDGVESRVFVASADTVVVYTFVARAWNSSKVESYILPVSESGRGIESASVFANTVATTNGANVSMMEAIKEPHRDKWILSQKTQLPAPAASLDMASSTLSHGGLLIIVTASRENGLAVYKMPFDDSAHQQANLTSIAPLPLKSKHSPAVSVCSACPCIPGLPLNGSTDETGLDHTNSDEVHFPYALVAADVLEVSMISGSGRLWRHKAMSPPLAGAATSVCAHSATDINEPTGVDADWVIAVAAAGRLQVFLSNRPTDDRSAPTLRKLPDVAHNANVTAVTAERGYLVTGDDEGSVVVWAVTDQGVVLQDALNHVLPPPVVAVSYGHSDEGDRLAAAVSASGVAKAWRMQPPSNSKGMPSWVTPICVGGGVLALVLLVVVPVLVGRRCGKEQADGLSAVRVATPHPPCGATSDSLGSNGRYEIIEDIGRGAHGCVYLARRRQDGLLFALKHIVCVAMSGEKALAEFRLLRDLYDRHSHRNLVRVHEVYLHMNGSGVGNGVQEDAAHSAPLLGRANSPLPCDTVCIVMDYYSGGDLASHLRSRGSTPVEESVLRRWAGELLSVLEYLHSQTPPVAHRDLKPENVLVSSSGELVVADFGLAKAVLGESGLHSSVGTLAYVAPECIKGTYGTEVDLWACGCVLHAAATGQHGAQRRVLFLDAERMGDSFGPAIVDEVVEAGHTRDFAELIRSLLCPDRRMRTTATEALTQLSRLSTPVPVSVCNSVNPNLAPPTAPALIQQGSRRVAAAADMAGTPCVKWWDG